MTHAIVTVMIEAEHCTSDETVAQRINELMQPYNENTSVEPHQETCWCVGRELARIPPSPEGEPWSACSRLPKEPASTPRPTTRCPNGTGTTTPSLGRQDLCNGARGPHLFDPLTRGWLAGPMGGWGGGV